MEQERHWSDNVADLLSGRIYNTLVSLNRRIDAQENTMTQNEQKILDAAQKLNDAAGKINAGLQALKDKAAELEVHEDLSDEFAALDSAVGSISGIGSNLTPAPAGTPASGDPPEATPPGTSDDLTSGGGPIDHPEIAPDPLGSPTDAGVPTEVSPPGTGGNTEETPTTPLAEDAQAEANPNLAPSEGGTAGTAAEGGPVGGTGEETPPNVADTNADASKSEGGDDGFDT